MALEVRDWADRERWDAFIGTQKSGNLNQCWAWGEVIDLLGAKPMRRAVVDGDKIKAVMSVASNEVRFTGKRILYVNRGPVVDNPSDDVFGALMDDLQTLARREQAVACKIEAYVPTADRRWHDLFRRSGYTPLFPPSQPRSQWFIDLSPSFDDLQTAMKPKWRYNIRLAQKRGVEVTRGTPDDVADFYALYQETAIRDGFYIHDEPVYRKIFGFFWKSGQFDLLMARLDGKPIAAVTLVTLGRNCWYVFGASGNKNREVMAPHALQWEAMKAAKERGAENYDMRGVSDVPSPDFDMSGVYRFKQGFGGRHVTLIDQYARGYAEPWYGMWKAYWRWRYTFVTLRRRRQGLPHRTWA